MKQMISIVIAILCLGHTAHASVWLDLAPAPDGFDCLVADPGPNQLVKVYVLAKSSGGDSYTSFRFAAPLPAGSGLTHLADLTPLQTFGNSQYDIAVPLGACESGTKVVLEMLFARTSAPNPCTNYTIQPASTYTNCEFSETPAGWTNGVFLAGSTHARNVSPANGATNVPLITTLTWEAGCSCMLMGSTVVFFGTDPDPPQLTYDVGTPYQVGPLQPGTTYYWKIAAPNVGPVWSFTTTNIVAVQSSTWGSVKALYR